jgi:hypothetical protein
MARTTFRLAAGRGFAVEDLRIVERTRAWSEPEAEPDHQLVFVRRGTFRLRLSHWDGLVDPLMAYVWTPEVEHRIAHRPDVEDSCTVVTLDAALAADVLPARPPPGRSRPAPRWISRSGPCSPGPGMARPPDPHAPRRVGRLTQSGARLAAR